MIPPAPPGAIVVPVTTADDGGVPLMRVEAPERMYDRDQVLGRDTASVFPTMAQANAEKVVTATQSVLGSMNFVTETELEEIKAKRGGLLRPEDGTAAPERSLWEAIQEAKEAKERAFQEGWKTMKQGQNKPLDEEEAEFLDDMMDQRREEDRRRAERERDDVEAFRMMRETMVVRAAPPRTAPGGTKRNAEKGAEKGADKGADAKRPKTGLGAAVVVRPKIVAAKRRTESKPADPEPKPEPAVDADDDDEGGLGGLLGYGSESDDE